MKNSQYLILVLICFLLSCQNVKVNDESNVIAIEETKVVVDSLNENSKDSIIKSVSENQPLDSILAHTAVSFHNWYNKGIGNDSIVIDASIILYEEDSTMVLDTSEYFNNLRALGTISETFINSEFVRIQECYEAIDSIKSEEYRDIELYELEEYCSFVVFYYWVNAQEPVAQTRIESINQTSDSTATVNLIIYEVDGEGKELYKSTFLISLEKDESWKISEITEH